MKKKITETLRKRNSYFKWSNQRLAKNFDVSPRTISSIINTLAVEKKNYLESLKN